LFYLIFAKVLDTIVSKISTFTSSQDQTLKAKYIEIMIYHKVIIYHKNHKNIIFETIFDIIAKENKTIQ